MCIYIWYILHIVYGPEGNIENRKYFRLQTAQCCADMEISCPQPPEPHWTAAAGGVCSTRFHSLCSPTPLARGSGLEQHGTVPGTQIWGIYGFYITNCNNGFENLLCLLILGPPRGCLRTTSDASCRHRHCHVSSRHVSFPVTVGYH